MSITIKSFLGTFSSGEIWRLFLYTPLDAESEYWVPQALFQSMARRTTIAMAHRLGTVKSRDRIAVLNHGRLEALGTYAELIVTSVCMHAWHIAAV